MTIKEQIKELWSTVLGNDSFSDDDNIMDIGADSMMIYKISSVAVEQYHFTVSPMDIMMHPTVNKLSRFIEDPHNNENTAVSVDIAARKRRLRK